jgi:hypothetical protein
MIQDSMKNLLEKPSIWMLNGSFEMNWKRDKIRK